MSSQTDYIVEGEPSALPGSICIQCGFAELQSQRGEWWCPDCWEGGRLPDPAPPGWYDKLRPNADVRAIIDVQRSQLRAKRNGEVLGQASILGRGHVDGHVPLEPPADDTAPFERPAGNYLEELFAEVDEELGRNYKPPQSRTWISSEFPELDWLVYTRHFDQSLRPSLHRAFPQIPNHVWKVLLDG